MQITFNVQGKPIGQPRQRHRIISKGPKAFVHNYTPASGLASNWKRLINFAATNAMTSKMTPMFVGPVSVSLLFLFQVRSKPQKFRTKKPDLDNLAKLVLDAMNGVVYADDNQVAVLTLSKRESATSCGVWVMVEGLE